MHLTIVAWDDRIISIEIDGDETVESLKAILEAEAGVSMAQQTLIHQNRPLPDGSKLSANGVTDQDMIMLTPNIANQQPARQGQGRQAAPAQNPSVQLNSDGSAVAPAAFIQAIKNDRNTLATLEQNNARLAKLIRDEDVEGVQAELRRVHQARLDYDQQMRKEEELLQADPFDADAQRRIEELIHQKNIEENLAQAMEHTPEVFGSVEMLYVNMEVNGVPVKTFIDSGAQSTIMTMDFAEKCFLSRLIDKRFAGMAVGVGSSRIIGRIHQCPLKVGGHYITTSITVLEQKSGPQFIFGLDMLKRHQCVIDLASSLLRFGSCNASLDFLPEHEIPKDFKRHIEEVSETEAAKNMAEAKRDCEGSGPSTSQPAAGSSAPVPMEATPQPAAAAAPTVAPVQVASSDAEGKVQRLMALGFDRATCQQALAAAGGNEDAAASFLFGDM